MTLRAGDLAKFLKSHGLPPGTTELPADRQTLLQENTRLIILLPRPGDRSQEERCSAAPFPETNLAADLQAFFIDRLRGLIIEFEEDSHHPKVAKPSGSSDAVSKFSVD